MPVAYDTLVADPILDVYGQEVIFSPVASDPGSGSRLIMGVFDEAHEVVLTEVGQSETDAPGHSTTAPVLTVKLSSLAKRPRQGDVVEIAGTVYEVWNTMPDGRGMMDLVLREAVD